MAKSNLFDIRGLSIFAKMLSGQNMVVYEDTKATTAYFNLETRTLVLPTWVVPDSVQKMLVAHEISHAIHTPPSEWIDEIEKFGGVKKGQPLSNKAKLFQTIVNIVEDVRIDKLIQRKYAGVRKFYLEAYHFIANNPIKNRHNSDSKGFDFFPSAEKLVTESFISKLNVYGKLVLQGCQKISVPFNTEETKLVERVALVEKFSDVISVSKDIYDYLEKNNQVTDDMMSSIIDMLFSAIKDFIESKDGNRDFEKNPINSNDLGDFLKNQIEIFDKMEKILEKLNDMSDEEKEKYIQENREKADEKNSNVFVVKHISLNDIISKNRKNSRHGITNRVPDKIAANFMRSQFNRFKNAKRIHNTRYSDSGELDVNMLPSYRINPKIFGKEKIVNRQKNHGVIVLVDGSGSMSSCMKDVATQVYNMFLFCTIERIPFVCYVFHGDNRARGYNIDKGLGGYSFTEYFKSRKDAANDFNDMCCVASGGTPLSSSLVGLVSVAEDFKNKHNIDILNVMIITDGDCDRSNLQYATYRHETTNITVSSGQSPTGKNDSQYALYKIISDVANANVLTFRISNSISSVVTLKNVGGVKAHFNIPIGALEVSDTVESRIFLQTLIKEMN